MLNATPEQTSRTATRDTWLDLFREPFVTAARRTLLLPSDHRALAPTLSKAIATRGVGSATHHSAPGIDTVRRPELPESRRCC
jgi:hypothetical protein